MTAPLQPSVFTVDWSDPANMKVARQAWAGLFWERGRGLLWVAAVCVVLAALFFVGGGRALPLLLLVLAGLAGLLLGLSYLGFQRRVAHFPQPTGQAIYRLDPQGLHVQAERQTTDYDWNAVRRVVEHRDYLGLLMPDGGLITVPKRGLPIPAELWFGQIPVYNR